MVQNKKKVLIVEDEFISAEYLRELLVHKNYDVVDIVDNGPEAIQLSKTLKPDLILMDIMIQGSMSGCEAAMQIHHDNKDIKFIFLTAYLTKPYRENEILATM